MLFRRIGYILKSWWNSALALAILVVLAAVIFYFPLTKNTPSKQKEPIISLEQEAGSYKIKIREKEKKELKKIFLRIKNFIYREATVNNPQGDILPDQIDDKIIKDLKNKLE